MPNERDAPDASRRRRLHPLLSGSKALVAIAGGLVTLAAATTLVVTTVRALGDKAPSEAERLEQLQGGMTFERFHRTLGAEPDVQRPVGKAPDAKFLAGKRATRYVFARRDVYVQAVVVDGTVIGFAIVARTRKLEPSFKWPTAPIAVSLGRSSFARYQPERLGGFCGASRAQYFETFGGSNADNAQEFAVGVSTIGFADDRVFNAICEAGERLSDCDAAEFYVNVMFQPDSASCFLGTPESKPLRDFAINTYVETAPSTPLFSELLAPLEPEVEGITPAT